MSDTEFTQVNSPRSHVELVSANSVRKGGHVMIKGCPCKVVETSRSKPGKHGHAKVKVVGIDIFTGFKHETFCSSSHNVESPVVNMELYQLLNIDEDDYITLMSENGETRSDLKLPMKDGRHDDIALKMKELFENEKEVTVTVLKACDNEKVYGLKETPV